MVTQCAHSRPHGEKWLLHPIGYRHRLLIINRPMRLGNPRLCGPLPSHTQRLARGIHHQRCDMWNPPSYAYFS